MSNSVDTTLGIALVITAMAVGSCTTVAFTANRHQVAGDPVTQCVKDAAFHEDRLECMREGRDPARQEVRGKIQQ